jgi:hypothetical protein
MNTLHTQEFQPDSNRVSLHRRCTCKRCSPSQDFCLDCRKGAHIGTENVALAFRPERPSALHKASLGLSQPARHRRSEENHVSSFVELGIQRRHHVVLAFKAALQLYERRQRALHLLGLQVIQNFVGRQDARLEQEANEAGIQYTAYEFRRVRR